MNLLLLLLAAGAPARADETTTSLSLNEALRLVVERNPDHESAALAVLVAEIEARRARLDRFSFTVATGAGTSAGFVKPWGADTTTSSSANWDARVNAGVPIYAGGAVNASIALADAGDRLAETNQALTDRSLVRATYGAYWTIKGYELQIAALEEGLGLTEQSLAVITAKANAGLAAGIDVNRSTVDLYSQQESLIAQKAAMYDAEQELIQLLHLPGDHLVLTDGPPEPSTASVTLPADAGAGRPELLHKEYEADQAEASLKLARSAGLPSLTLSGTAGVGGTGVGGSTVGAGGTGVTSPLNAEDLRPSVDGSVGLTLSWNPFDLFRVHDSVEQARLATKQVEAGTEAERTQIAADLRRAASRVEQLRKRVPLADAQANLARDNLQIVQDLYGQGSATILDLFNAQSSFRQARTAGATIRVDLATAECDLRWLLGEDLTASGATP